MIWESEWSCCREVDLVRDLAEEHVFLSERECRDEYESLIQLHTRAIATQIKDIESQFQSRAGQADVSAELGTLENLSTNSNNSASTTQEETEKDIGRVAKRSRVQ